MKEFVKRKRVSSASLRNRNAWRSPPVFGLLAAVHREQLSLAFFWTWLACRRHGHQQLWSIAILWGTTELPNDVKRADYADQYAGLVHDK